MIELTWYLIQIIYPFNLQIAEPFQQQTLHRTFENLEKTKTHCHVEAICKYFQKAVKRIGSIPFSDILYYCDKIWYPIQITYIIKNLHF